MQFHDAIGMHASNMATVRGFCSDIEVILDERNCDICSFTKVFLPFVCRVASCCVRKLTLFFWGLLRLEAGYVDDELPIEAPKLACKYCTNLDFGRPEFSCKRR